LLAAAVFASPAEAIGPGEGEFKAVGTGTAVAPGSEIAIRPDASDGVVGNDPIHIAAREAATQALAARGMRLVERAPLILKLDVTSPGFGIEKQEDERANSIVSSDASAQQGPSRKSRVATHIELPFSDALTNGHPGVSAALMLYDERGRTLWSASFKALGRVSEPDAMIRRMVREMLASFGAQVERRYLLTCEKQAEVRPDETCLP
jgi:hypothetical protein